MLPPQLLRLFAPRPPLPYAKPLGRDPDLPLKSRARKPPVIGVAQTLQAIRRERERVQDEAFEKGQNPDEAGDADVKPAKDAAVKREPGTVGDSKPVEGNQEDKKDDDKVAKAEDGPAPSTKATPATETIKKRTAPRDPELEAIEQLPVNDRPKARRELKKKRHEQRLKEGIEHCSYRNGLATRTGPS